MGMPGPLEELLTEVRKIDSLSAQLMLRESYEQMYGLFDHNRFSKAMPLAVVSMHPKENSSEYSPLYRMAYKYDQHDILKLTGLNYKEFLDLPREQCELWFKIAREKAIKEKPLVDAALRAATKLDQQGR
jgi:hypothetical protein